MAVTNKLVRDSLYKEYEGESTDEKPTDNVGLNSKFYELDTKNEYYFDGSAWKKVGGE